MPTPSPENEPKIPEQSSPEASAGQPAAAETIDVQALVSRLNVALTSGTNVGGTLQEVNAAHGRISPNQQALLVGQAARAAAEHPNLLGAADFWQTFQREASPFYIALLRGVERMATGNSSLAARVKIMKGGYLGRVALAGSEEEIAEAFAGSQKILDQLDDPEAERLLARQQYEQHRTPFNQAQKYLAAVAQVDHRDAESIAKLQQEHHAEVEALRSAIECLGQSETTDRANGHDMFANQTRNRIIALQMEGRLISLEGARAAFETLDQNYDQIDPRKLRMGTAKDLARFRGNTAGRLGEVAGLLGNTEEALCEKKRGEAFAKEAQA